MSLRSSFKKTINFNYSFLQSAFGNKPFSLLDVGAGNHSATRITNLFPACTYYGLDLDRHYNYDDEDFRRMRDFYEIDLTTLDYSSIPDAHFDAIWMVHVIEHLHNGDLVLKNLLTKLKPGGYLYIEYPGKKSTRLPSMHGTLNFYDDPTHVRLYSVSELRKLFTENHCRIVRAGTRRNWYYIAATPLRAALKIIRREKMEANIFWDLLGFAEFLFVQKK